MNRWRSVPGWLGRLRRCATLVACALTVTGVTSYDAWAQRPELVDPHVTQSTINTTICKPGYADEVLPPFDELMRMKAELFKLRGESGVNASDYALDHRLPVLLGGLPTAQVNLDIRRWDGRAGQRAKERLTVFLKRCVCTGEMPLTRAQADIEGDWPNRFPNLSSLTCSRH
jgi:hypothetical protein